MINRLSTYFKTIPLYLFMRPLGHNFYLYLLMPLLGFFHIIKKREVIHQLWPFFALFLYILALSFFPLNIFGIKRGIYGLLIIFFSQFLALSLDHQQFKKLAINVVWLIAFFFIFEVFIYGQDIKFKHIFFNIHLPFLTGPLGYSNITGITLASVALYFLIKRNYWYYLFSILLIAFTGSRSSFLIAILATFSFALEKLPRKLSSAIVVTTFISIILSPYLLIAFEKKSSSQTKIFLNNSTNGRYAIQQSFLKMHQESPLFGVGFYNSHNRFIDYKDKGSSIVEKNLVNIPYVDIDPHSTWIQILVELGIFGYLIYIFAMSFIFYIAIIHSITYAWSYICLLIGFMSLYGLSEFSWAFFLSTVIRNHLEKRNCYL